MKLWKDTADLLSEPAFHIFIYTEMRRYISKEPHCTFSRKIYLSFSIHSIVLLLSTPHWAAVSPFLSRPWRNNQNRSADSNFPALSGVKCKDCFFFFSVSQKALCRESATGRQAVDKGHNFKKAVQVQIKMVVWALLQIQSSFIYYHVRL